MVDRGGLVSGGHLAVRRRAYDRLLAQLHRTGHLPLPSLPSTHVPHENNHRGQLPLVKKCAVPREECRRDAHLPFWGREPVGG